MKSGRILGSSCFCLGILFLALLAYPIRSTAIKTLIVICGGSSILCGFALVPRKPVRLARLGLILLGVAFFSLFQGPPLDKDMRRSNYVGCLRNYEGVRYVWGGENYRGIDCSGLIRAGWIDARLKEGVLQRNSSALRDGLSVWWHDSSARELEAGFSQRTRVLHRASSIRANRDEGLLAGDFAIVANGVHALAYLGEHQWIEADPGPGKVIVIKSTDSNPWLDSAAVFVRWRELER